jgi:hypothetical protein
VHTNLIFVEVLWTSNGDPSSAGNMQTHFSSYAGVPGIKVDRDLSQGTVFGEADLNRVLRKLKKVDRLANAISAVKEKSQQWNSTRAVPPLCALAGRHCLYPHVLGSNYLPVSVHSHQGCVPMPGSNTYHAYQVSSLEHSLLSSGMLSDEAPSFHNLSECMKLLVTDGLCRSLHVFLLLSRVLTVPSP